MEIDIPYEYRRIGGFYAAMIDVLALPDDAVFGVRSAVSAWSPAHHGYHILRANAMMCKGIEVICRGSPPVVREGEPNLAGRTTLERGTFPRGRVQAPASVVPPAEITRTDLEESLARSRKRYAGLEALLPRIPAAEGRLPHVYLGVLNAAEWLRLIRIHSEHHLAIIHEIADAEEAA